MNILLQKAIIIIGAMVLILQASTTSAQECPTYDQLPKERDGSVVLQAVPPECEVPEAPDRFFEEPDFPREFCPVYEELPIGPDGLVWAEAVPPGCEIPEPPGGLIPPDRLIDGGIDDVPGGAPVSDVGAIADELPIDFLQDGVLPEELPEFVETNEEGQLFIDPLFVDPKTGKAFADPNGATLEQLGADIDMLGADDLKNLDDSVITKLNQEQLGGLSLEAISGFSDVQIEKLAPGALAGFTDQQLSALIPSALAKLSGSQVLGLSDSAVKGLSEKQIDALDALSFAGFRASQLAELSPEAIAGIKPEQFANLRNDALSGLKAEQISAITPETFTALTNQQLERLTVNAVAGLTAEQLAFISTSTIESINQKQLQSVSKEALEGLTANQFLALDKSALRGLNSANFSGLQPEILSAMTETDLDRLDPSDVAENFSNFVTNLNEFSISPEKVAGLLPEGWKIDSTGELEAPAGARLSFAALENAALPDIDGIYSALPDLNTTLSLGGTGGGETVIDGMNQALDDAGLTGITFIQEKDGVLNVSIEEDELPAASFVPDTSRIVQAPIGTVPGLEINEDTGGYIVTTDKGFQIPLLPSLINPAEVKELLTNSDILAGASGQLLISNVEGEGGIPTTIGAIAVPLLGTSSQPPGVYRSGVGSSESVTIVLEDGTSQKLEPAFYDQDSFKSAAEKIGIKDINFRLDGTVSLSFRGDVIKIKPLFAVEQGNSDNPQVPRLTLKDGIFFVTNSNGDKQQFRILNQS